jgi:hypothetical protein
MKNFIKEMDNLPWIVKLLLCIPALNIIWAIYRIVKGADTDSIIMIVIGVLWIIPGSAICWIIDLLCTIFAGRPTFFA